MKKINLKSGAMAAVLAGTMALSMVPATAFANEATVNDQTGITKTWDVASKNQYDDNQVFDFTLTYKGASKINGNDTAEPTGTPKTITLKGSDLKKVNDTEYTGSVSFKKAFEGVTFSRPGEYYYELAETKGDNPNPNVKYDESKYTVRVNVVWANVAAGTVEVNSVQTIKGGFAGTDKTYTPADKVPAKFTNSAAANDTLTVSKTVAGMAANTNDEFTYKLELTNAKGSYSYEKKGTGIDGSETGTIKSGDTFTLKHGQTIIISNLPDGASYTVTETETKGYDSTDVTDEDTTTPESVKKGEGAPTGKGTISNGGDTVAFTNNKGFMPATGVTMNMLPGIGIAVVAVAGGATLVISRRKHAGEDF